MNTDNLISKRNKTFKDFTDWWYKKVHGNILTKQQEFRVKNRLLLINR